MLGKIVGTASILYFLYTAYSTITTSGLFAIISVIYFVPYLLAGIFLLQGEYKTITILMGVLILFIPFYLSGYNISLILQNITSPINLIFAIILPALIIYNALKE
jgi:hypothetical protein